MYARTESREERREVLERAIRTIRFGTLVLADDEGAPQAVHAPFVLKTEGEGMLELHVARANPIWNCSPGRARRSRSSGATGLCRPGWYPAKAEHGKVVPTWSYVSVHARGVATQMDIDALLAHVREVSDQMESGYAVPWSVDDAPEGYITALARGIVGIRIPITSLEGVWKLNQHRSEADRHGMIAGLDGGKMRIRASSPPSCVKSRPRGRAAPDHGARHAPDRAPWPPPPDPLRADGARRRRPSRRGGDGGRRGLVSSAAATAMPTGWHASSSGRQPACGLRLHHLVAGPKAGPAGPGTGARAQGHHALLRRSAALRSGNRAAAGATLICQCQTIAHVDEAIAAGAAVVIAQGGEAGGHGMGRGLMSFVRRWRTISRARAGTILIAAGGIADGRGLAAALMLGAEGVLVGTRLWASEEALVHPDHHAAILATGGDGTIRSSTPDIARQLDCRSPSTSA